MIDIVMSAILIISARHFDLNYMFIQHSKIKLYLTLMKRDSNIGSKVYNIVNEILKRIKA